MIKLTTKGKIKPLTLGDWKLFGHITVPSNSTNVTVPVGDGEIIGNTVAMARGWSSRDSGVISLQHDLYPGKGDYLTN